MDPIIGGALISAGSSLLGGLFGDSAAKKQAKLQKEFAQNGIRWRVADAKAAGIHPLYALGAQVTPYSPVSVGDGGFAQAGQDLSRAYMATRTQEEKADAFTVASQRLQLQRLGLENELIAAQIKKTNAPENPAPFPGGAYMIPGQAQSGIVDKPMERTVAGIAENREPGALTDVGWARTNTGYAPVPSADVKQRIEDSFIPELMWFLRNNVRPTIGQNSSPPFEAPAGKYWEYDIWNQEYRLKDKRVYGSGTVRGW